ncbi:fibronectin/fibrinogen-binding protein [Paenibacillus hemerocallicola]|uniref:Rqc2 homolog RqcH n=1 Tax=Paenibacillus hemerocallicola TaxID=1172614 RepID=A0A5C4TF55_9BACL|nr:NFACT RNA binding domain-containing protein [Paenibacillus hemerocallicola]TNJ67197.1 fibronectin/fibrinogen-binding protein [Paenibacillus hemerocallicola]
MSLDGLVTRAIASELALCEGGRINKIYQPTGHDLYLHIRAQGQNRKLLISANPTYPRVHFTEAQSMNPTEAPMFCMLMRKHCEGAVIERISQVGLERILHIDVRQRDEIGDISFKRIVIEIMGRHSNIILLDPATGTVLDGIHHVTPAISGYRIVMPGSSYTAPPEQGKANPLEATEAQFAGTLRDEEDSGKPVRQTLVDRYSGLSPLAAKEIVHRSGAAAGATVGQTDAERLWGPFRETMTAIASGRYEPVIVEEAASGKTFFSVMALTHLEGTVTRFDSVSACLEAYYGDKAERDAVKQRASDLLRFLQNERNKNAKKLEKLRETIEEAKEADDVRILGELLTASLHLMRKGDKSVEVVNYYDEEQKPVRIELDPQLTPSENAQRYFKKYTKMRNSLSAVEEQIDSTNAEIVYMDTLLAHLDRASLADIEGIREELVEQGYVRERGGKKRGGKKKKADKPLLTCYTSGEGLPIYVGKNNIQNEYLTNRLAQPNDTWLHTKDIPGSHVVIRADKFGETTLQEAAMLAAYYSQAKSSSQVPVDFTLIRHVRKPNGSKPGFVIYERQKTLYMTPDERAVKAMPVSVK